VVKLITEILKVFEKNNLFEEGVELIGSWCFYLYQQKLGAPSFPLRTQDIDFLIPNPFKGKEHKNFIKQLENLGFQSEFKRNGSLYPVGDHENGPKTNQGGSVDNALTRKYLLEENVVFPRWT